MIYLDQGGYESYSGKTKIPHIHVTFDTYLAKMPMTLYENLAYYLQYVSYLPKVGIDGQTLGGNYQIKQDFPEIEQQNHHYSWYFDVNGNYLGEDTSFIYQTQKLGS